KELDTVELVSRTNPDPATKKVVFILIRSSRFEPVPDFFAILHCRSKLNWLSLDTYQIVRCHHCARIDKKHRDQSKQKEPKPQKESPDAGCAKQRKISHECVSFSLEITRKKVMGWAASPLECDAHFGARPRCAPSVPYAKQSYHRGGRGECKQHHPRCITSF